jgi:hypothetical protein
VKPRAEIESDGRTKPKVRRADRPGQRKIGARKIFGRRQNRNLHSEHQSWSPTPGSGGTQCKRAGSAPGAGAAGVGRRNRTQRRQARSANARRITRNRRAYRAKNPKTKRRALEREKESLCAFLASRAGSRARAQTEEGKILRLRSCARPREPRKIARAGWRIALLAKI